MLSLSAGFHLSACSFANLSSPGPLGQALFKALLTLPHSPQDPWLLPWGALPISNCFQGSSRGPLGSGWQPSSCLTWHSHPTSHSCPTRSPSILLDTPSPPPCPLLPTALWILSKMLFQITPLPSIPLHPVPAHVTFLSTPQTVAARSVQDGNRIM